MADRGVQPGGVVPVDPAGDLPLDITTVPPGTGADRLGLEQSDGGLAQGVVQGVADGADRAGDPGLEQFGGQRHGHVLRARVGVMDQPTSLPGGTGQPSGLYCLAQRVNDEVGVAAGGDPPAQDPSGEDCGSPRFVEGFSMRLPGWGPWWSRR